MNDIKKYMIKATIEKTGNCRYLSQLDLQRLYIRVIRRAKLPIFYSQGFNPHPKMSYLNALKTGQEGLLEVVFQLTEDISPEEFKTKLNEQFAEGMTVVEAQKYTKPKKNKTS